MLFGRKIHTKLPEYEETADDGHTQTTSDLEARDNDAEDKQHVGDHTNRGTSESDLEEGEKVLLEKNNDRIN